MKTLSATLFCLLLSYAVLGNLSDVVISQSHVNPFKLTIEKEEPSSTSELKEVIDRDMQAGPSNDAVSTDAAGCYFSFPADFGKQSISGRSISNNSSSSAIDLLKRADIIGKWKSPFYNRKNGRLAELGTDEDNMWKTGYEFRDDGSFHRHIQEANYVEAELGIWSLTKDRQFIMLDYTIDGSPKNTYKKEVLNIVKYKKGRMVITSNAANTQFMSKIELRKS